MKDKALTDALTPEMERELDALYNNYEEAYTALSKYNLLMKIARVRQGAIYRKFQLATEYSNLTRELKVTDGKEIRFKMKKRRKKEEVKEND